jgi:hypothetical protein
LLVLERTGSAARLYTTALGGAHNILGSAWDNPMTEPSLESVADLAALGVRTLAKTEVANLSAIREMPEKIEGIAIVDATTVAVTNDNDFDIGTFDQYGNNRGEGLKTQVLTVTLDRPLE